MHDAQTHTLTQAGQSSDSDIFLLTHVHNHTHAHTDTTNSVQSSFVKDSIDLGNLCTLNQNTPDYESF